MTSVSGQLTLSTIGAVERSARNPGAEALRCRRHRMGRTDVRARTDAAGFKAHLVKPIDYDAVRKKRCICARGLERSNSVRGVTSVQ